MAKKKICEESIVKCFKRCLQLTYSKIIKFYDRWESKFIRYLVMFIIGVPPSFFVFFLITSVIPVPISDTIEKQFDNYCLESFDYKIPFEKEMWFYWDRPCFNISLGQYDIDYKDYEVVISRIFYETKSDWIGQKYIQWKEPISAYGFIKIPQHEYQKVSYREQKFILANTTIDQIEIPEKEGKIKLLNFKIYDDKENFEIQFTHYISLWEWLLKFTYIKK